MWEIADHVLINIPHNLTITDWEKRYMKQIQKANDYTFYIDFITIEMGKLVSGENTVYNISFLYEYD